jgi:hypothetical protein
MKFIPLRALVFFLIGLQVGFIVVAFAFAVSQAGVSAGAILPSALVMAAGAGLLGGLQRPQP